MVATLSIPMELVRRADVSAAAKLLYGVLARHARGTGVVQRSVAQLAQELNEAPRNVQRAMASLLAAEVVEQVPTGRAPRYRLRYAGTGVPRDDGSGGPATPDPARRGTPETARHAGNGVSETPDLAGRSRARAEISERDQIERESSDAHAPVRAGARGELPRELLQAALLRAFGRLWCLATRSPRWPASARQDLVDLVLDALEGWPDQLGRMERGLERYFAACAKSGSRPEFGWDLARDFGRWCGDAASIARPRAAYAGPRGPNGEPETEEHAAHRQRLLEEANRRLGIGADGTSSASADADLEAFRAEREEGAAE